MPIKDRRSLENLIKDWAQDHTTAFIIADGADSNQGILNTSGYLTWLVQQEHANLDLLALVDKLEIFLCKNKSNDDGMFCRKCQNFLQFAESNGADGSFICWSCRNHNR